MAYKINEDLYVGNTNKQLKDLLVSVQDAYSTSTTDTYSCNYINSIIESGSNENGTYIKFADGTMIITQNFTKNMKINTKESGTYLYYGILHKEDIPPYPQIFTSILSANINIFDNRCMCGVGTQDGPGISKISNRIYVYSTASVTKDVKFYVFVIGRWK